MITLSQIIVLYLQYKNKGYENQNKQTSPN